MNAIDLNSVADIVFQLRWKSSHASHNEYYAAQRVNLWRDWLPDAIRKALMGKCPLDETVVDFTSGALFGNTAGPVKIERKCFALTPSIGRFYPKGHISGLPGIFPQNLQPFRCVDINNGHLLTDMAHPLASYPLSIRMMVGQVAAKADERGGSCVDWVGMLTDGPGMQARWHDTPTDFFSGDAFSRQDEREDSWFYRTPRLVHHLDRTARDMVIDVYRRFIRDDSAVLDLMSSWVSHVPAEVKPSRISGLGMNRTELEQNPDLTDIQVHDLNIDPVLPYRTATYDVVLCTVSVEYLTRPLEVFKQIGRVLKPGGTFAVTFSNRWFRPKVIRIWEQLHEFERIGLVMEYFLQSGVFDALGTYSMRGLVRPRDDKYAAELPFSDPIYAVWGTKKA